MKTTLVAQSTIEIGAPTEKVWSVIANPKTLQQVMLGMEPVSDWKVGSELRWKGRHEEKPDDNAKGILLAIEAKRTLRFTFYYPGYGYPDVPENYNTVLFALSQRNNSTIVAVEQGDFSIFKEGETFRNHSQTFWETALVKLKEIAENQNVH